MRRFYEFTSEEPKWNSFTINIDHVRVFEKLSNNEGYLIVFADNKTKNRKINVEQYNKFMKFNP